MQSTEFSRSEILEWVAFCFSRGSSQLRDQTQVSCIAGRFFTTWATREALAWAIFCTRYPLILANYILYRVLTFTALSSRTTLCSSPLFELQKAGPSTIYKRQWTQILDYWAARFSYWATWHSTYDCFWNNARERIQDPYTFIPHHLPVTASPHLI